MRPTYSYSGEMAYNTERSSTDTNTINRNFGSYEFGGWKSGETPVERFDIQDWPACLHGCVLALTIINDPVRTQREIEDDGIIHELIHELHIAQQLGHNIDWINYANLRIEIQQLQDDALGAYERAKTEYHYLYTQQLSRGFRQDSAESKQEELQGERSFTIYPSADIFYSSKPLREQVLQRTGEEKTSSAFNNTQAERPNNVRD